MNRALRVAWPALMILVALVTAIIATTGASGGGSPLIVVRAAVLVLLDLSIAAVLGAVLTAVLEAEPDTRTRLLDVAAGAAAVWAIAAAATAFLLYLGEAPALDSPAFGPGLVAFVADVEIGRTWVVAAASAALLTALLVAVRSRRGVAVLWLLSVGAAVPVALQSAVSGLALGDERTIVAAGLVQLVAVGTWTGGAAVGTARGIAVPAFVAILIGVGAAAPVLAAEGAMSPVALVGAAAVVLAGIVAVLAALTRADLRVPQLLLLGIATGLGVAASVTRAVPDVPDRVSPAQILTGAPLPAAPSVGSLLGTWQPDGSWLAVAAGLLVGYVLTLRRARTRWSAARAASWIAGVVVLVWLTSGAPAVYQHVLVVPQLARLVALLLVVPLLLAGGAPSRLFEAAFPGRRPRLGGVRPVPALVLAVAVVALVCGTSVLRWSVADALGTEVVTAALLIVGVLLVRALGAPEAPRRSAIVVAVVLLGIETAGAVLVASSGSLLLADWYGAMGWGTDALAAQRSAAAVVWPIAAIPTVVLLVVLLVNARRSRSPEPTPVARPAEMTA